MKHYKQANCIYSITNAQGITVNGFDEVAKVSLIFTRSSLGNKQKN